MATHQVSNRIDCFLCKKTNVKGSPLYPLGLLSKCTHSFCAPCIVANYEAPESSKTCPVCGVQGTIVIWTGGDIKDIGIRSQYAKLQERAVKAYENGRKNRKKLNQLSK